MKKYKIFFCWMVILSILSINVAFANAGPTTIDGREDGIIMPTSCYLPYSYSNCNY